MIPWRPGCYWVCGFQRGGEFLINCTISWNNLKKRGRQCQWGKKGLVRNCWWRLRVVFGWLFIFVPTSHKTVSRNSNGVTEPLHHVTTENLLFSRLQSAPSPSTSGEVCLEGFLSGRLFHHMLNTVKGHIFTPIEAGTHVKNKMLLITNPGCKVSRTACPSVVQSVLITYYFLHVFSVL